MEIERTVLVVHDVVNDFFDPGDPALPAVVRNIATLVEAAHRVGLPVFFAAPDHGTPGCEIIDALPVGPDDIVVRKPRYGAFFGTRLAAQLRVAGRDTVIVCGISLAGGVETTVRDAHNADLRSILPADACLCRGIPDQGWGAVSSDEVAKVVLSLMAQRFARVTTTAELVRELGD